MKNRKKKTIIGIVILVILIVILLLCLRSCHNNEPPDNTTQTEITPETSDESKELDFEAATEPDKITIPAITGLSMKSGKTHQTVDFYNPETNNCYFQLSLYLSDDTLLYRSDYLKPSEKITEIEISQTLEKGKYKNCRLSFDCFTLDEAKEPLNSGTVILEITAQ